MKLCCLDAQTGKELWRVDVLKAHEGILPWYGNYASPVVEGGEVIVAGGGPGQFVLAFNKNTGQLVWKTETAINQCSTPSGHHDPWRAAGGLLPERRLAGHFPPGSQNALAFGCRPAQRPRRLATDRDGRQSLCRLIHRRNRRLSGRSGGGWLLFEEALAQWIEGLGVDWHRRVERRIFILAHWLVSNAVSNASNSPPARSCGRKVLVPRPAPFSSATNWSFSPNAGGLFSSSRNPSTRNSRGSRKPSPANALAHPPSAMAACTSAATARPPVTICGRNSRHRQSQRGTYHATT